MAQQTSFSPRLTVCESVPLKKPVFGVALFRKSQLPVKKAVKLQIKCSIRDLVFEDHATGIICYKDERGEMICEGFDEGPRIPPILNLYHPSRHFYIEDADILDRLQRSWLQLIDGQTANERALLEDRRFNGF